MVLTGSAAGRNQKYLDLAIQFTMDVVKDRTILIFFPHFLRPYVNCPLPDRSEGLRLPSVALLVR